MNNIELNTHPIFISPPESEPTGDVEPRAMGVNVMKVIVTEEHGHKIHEFTRLYDQFNALIELSRGGVVDSMDLDYVTTSDVAFLRTDIGADELRTWLYAFRVTKSQIDIAIDLILSGTHAPGQDWQGGIDLMHNAFSALRGRIGQIRG
jgi:hypothetical protein